MTGSGPHGANDAARPTRHRWASTVMTGLFGLLFAYDLFEAISNLFGVVAQIDAYNAFAAANGLEIAATPWLLLVVTLVMPPVGFGVSWWAGRAQGIGMRALVFVGGLAVVAAVTLSLTALA